MINVTKLTTDQFEKYYEFALSVYGCNYVQCSEEFFTHVRDEVLPEQRKRDHEDRELEQRLRPFIAEEIEKHINHPRRR